MLRKSSRRDPRAIDYGTYQIIDPTKNAVIGYNADRLTLEQVEDWLRQ